MAHGITAPYRWLLAALVVSLAALVPHGTRTTAPSDHVVDAFLLSRGQPLPDCGHFAFESEMTFADVGADNATRTVLVPCAEMPRPMYCPDAGNAPVLEVGSSYRLELVPVDHDRWRATRIDLLTRPLE